MSDVIGYVLQVLFSLIFLIDSSGKTHTMMGADPNLGIIPQLNNDLFDKLNQKITALSVQESSGGGVTKFMVTVRE